MGERFIGVLLKMKEFIELVQGDEPRFILEIIEFKPRIDYGYLQN